MTRPVLRFAPSPNGRLHLGHAYSALLNAELARRMEGRFLVRIEDIDKARCRPDYEQAIFADLAWLGLRWEEPVRRQSEHVADYRAAFEKLRQRRLVFPCFCSRGDIARAVAARGEDRPRDPDGAPLYPGCCRALDRAEVEARLAAGVPHSWRLEMEAARPAVPAPLAFVRFTPGEGESVVEALPERWGDAVIVRKDFGTSYHLSVVVDDGLQGVTHVVRGADLAAATDLHVLLQQLLDLPSPAYHHHRLILDAAGRKLSKSAGSPSLADLRAGGAMPNSIRAELGFPPA